MTDPNHNSAGAPDLSVVIATFNRRQTLLRALSTVFAQDYPPARYEVVVVDDGSTDGTAEALQALHPACRFRVIRQANCERAVAQNAGIAAATGRVILFLDDDLLCEPDLISEHLAARNDGNDVVVFGPLPFFGGHPRGIAGEAAARIFARAIERANHAAEPAPGDCMVCANTSVPRRLLREAAGFDPHCVPAQDAELGLRLKVAGVRFRYAPRAVARQLYVKPRQDVLHRDATRYGRAEVYLCRKHPWYRPHSQLTTLASGPLWKRGLRSAAVRVPFEPQRFLSAPIAVAERCFGIPALREAGLRLHGLQYRLAFLRAAARECGSWTGLTREFGRRLPIFMYHHVGPPAGLDRRTSVTPRAFERHIRWLARQGYEGVTLAQWTAWVRCGAALPRKPVVLTFDDAYAGIARFALPVLRAWNFRATVFVVTDRIGRSSDWNGACQAPLMDASQILSWAGQGFEFGSHSATHPDLTQLPDSALLAELRGSRESLQSLLGMPVESFAYPYGAHDERVRAAVREVYSAAVTVDKGINHLDTDLYLLGRTDSYSSDTVLDVSTRAAMGDAPWVPFTEPVLRRLRSMAATSPGKTSE
jgi:peptidoglycan/xylan/chitin deacetylase (PgdA/CDA1 family)/glycosyltransferase involved in cell wall biosynthesis